MKTTRVFDMTSTAWLLHPRYISSCGGTRSGKTYSILQLFYLQLLSEELRKSTPTVNSIVSESMPHLKRGVIRDFKSILTSEGVWDESKWSETDKAYKFNNGSILEFFSVDNAGKVFGSARDRLFVNEAQHISWEIARQLFVRTRKGVVIDYNPTHHFWVMDRIENKDNCIRIHSTYKDNGYLTPEQVREIEDNKSDANWWKVFGEGKEGTLDGLIYDFEQIDALPSGDEASSLKECYGLDFGFTNDPTSLIHILADTRRKILYLDEVCYRTRMLNDDIVAVMKESKVGNAEIFADCAEPKSIADIKRSGFNIKACDKDAPVKSDKLRFQIQWMQGWQIKVTKQSLNLIKEGRNYTWAKDSDGNPLNYPIDKFNHAWDAARYGAWTKFAERGSAGKYSISYGR